MHNCFSGDATQGANDNDEEAEAAKSADTGEPASCWRNLVFDTGAFIVAEAAFPGDALAVEVVQGASVLVVVGALGLVVLLQHAGRF